MILSRKKNELLLSNQNELLMLIAFSSLGTITSYLSVKIPHTEVLIEGRFIFGFMGFALLRHFWSAMILACILSISGPHSVPTFMCFLGNMLYELPALALIRFVHFYFLSRYRNMVVYGAGWFLLVMICYQAFTTPILWAFLAILHDMPVWSFVVSGWYEQPLFIESLLVGIVSASCMVMFRTLGELRRSRYELAMTMFSINEGIIATDAQGCVTRINAVAQNLTGWSIEEAWGKPIDEIFRVVNEKTNQSWKNLIETVLQHGVIKELNSGAFLISRNGVKRRIFTSAGPVQDDGLLIGAVIAFRDVTSEYEAHEMLRKSEDLLRKAEEIAHIGSWEFDISTNRAVWSDQTYRIFGYPYKSEVSYKDFLEILHPKDRDNVNAAYLESVQKGMDSHEIEYRIIRAYDKELRYIHEKSIHIKDASGNIIKSTGMVHDVTERRQNEEKLRFQSQILDQIQDCITVTNMEGIITYVNNAVCQLLGIEREHIIGKHVSIYGEDESLGATQEQIISETLEKGRWRGEIVNYSNDGKTIFFDCRTQIITDINGEPVALCGISTDINERKQAEAERERMAEEKSKLETQVYQIQKLESIGRLAGGVAHDLNNLLSPILGYGEMLIDNIGDKSKQKSFAEGIVQAGIRASDLVRQLLAFSRKQLLEFKPIDLNNILQGFEKLLRRTIREDIIINIIKDSALPLIRGDIGQLEQVIMNLAVNAQDAMPTGGTLTIETGITDLDENYASTHPGVKPGRYVMLVFSDTGCGMDKDTCDKIFEPFFSTKGEHGTGLGLATVYGIVKQHSGNIWAYSEPGKGATFKVYLPVPDEHVEPLQHVSIIHKNPSGSETILLVEDDESVRSLCNMILEKYGYKVLSAKNGQEAISLIEQHKNPVHLILTDVVMPGISGKQLFDNISKKYTDIKVLFMSGYTNNIIAHRGVLDQGVNFIQKPFSIKALATKVREVLDK